MATEKVVVPPQSAEQNSSYLIMRDTAAVFFRAWMPPMERVERIAVCIHGISSHSGYFAQIGEHLSSKSIGVVAIDLRGNGKSPGKASVKAHLGDISEVVKLLKERYDKPVALIGHSLGAIYALRYAAQNPRELESLVLAAPALKIRYGAGLEMVAFPFRKSKTELDTSKLWPEEVRESPMGVRMSADELSKKTYAVGYLRAVRRLLRKALDYSEEIATPTLILQAEDDLVVDPEGASRIFKRIPTGNKKMCGFESGGHTLHDAFFLPAKEGSNERTEVIERIEEWLGSKIRVAVI